jgi:hypothetical protein
MQMSYHYVLNLLQSQIPWNLKGVLGIEIPFLMQTSKACAIVAGHCPLAHSKPLAPLRQYIGCQGKKKDLP